MKPSKSFRLIPKKMALGTNGLIALLLKMIFKHFYDRDYDYNDLDVQVEDDEILEYPDPWLCHDDDDDDDGGGG